VAADYGREDVAAWQRKLLGIFEEILAASAAVQNRAKPGRLRLTVSYVRTMRGFIANVLALMPEPPQHPPEVSGLTRVAFLAYRGRL
jgi:hypothetical protein